MRTVLCLIFKTTLINHKTRIKYGRKKSLFQKNLVHLSLNFVVNNINNYKKNMPLNFNSK